MMPSSIAAAFRGRPVDTQATLEGSPTAPASPAHGAQGAQGDGASFPLGFGALLRALLGSGSADPAVPESTEADPTAAEPEGDGSGRAGRTRTTKARSERNKHPHLPHDAELVAAANRQPALVEGSDPSGSDEAPEASATESATTKASRLKDVRRVDRALSHLTPGLRTKVERVIQRMADERGEKVALVEGFRTPERQAYLYAQGRTRPGPVVTWTTDSRHNSGEAADLKVEGSWNQRSSYAALQRIAKEEGLATLGMKDPGHVELPAAQANVASEVPEALDASEASQADATTPEASPEADVAVPMERLGLRVAAVARTARVSRVADAANVASVASVARAARVTAPGRPARATDHTAPPPSAVDTPAALHTTAREARLSADIPRTDTTPTETAPADTAPAGPGERGHHGGPRSGQDAPTAPVVDGPVRRPATGRDLQDRGREEGRRSRRDVSTTPVRSRGDQAPESVRSGGSAPTVAHGSVRATASPQHLTATPADTLGRVEAAMELKDALGVTPANRVSVRLDGTTGPVQRVQVELADAALRSVVDVGDPTLAASLRDGREELVRALTEKGFDPRELAVRLASTRSDATRSAQDAGLGGLRMDGAAGALRAMLSGDGAGAQNQNRSSQGQHRSPDGWFEGRHQNSSNNRSREEQRRERR